VIAADFSAVRRSLGIDTWSLWAASAGMDIAAHLVDTEPDTVTSIVSHNPMVAGHGDSANSMAAAFDAYVAECAWVESCAKDGNPADNLAAAIEFNRDGYITKTLEPQTGRPIVLSQNSTRLATRFGLSEPQFVQLVNSILKGAANGSTAETIAGLYLSRPISLNVLDFALTCQDVDFIAIGLVTTADDRGGQFTGVANQPWCDRVGRSIKVATAPALRSGIPAFVVRSEFNNRSSDDNVQAIFGGFVNPVLITVPGISNAVIELKECFETSAAAFMTDPGSQDATCLSQPAVGSLGPRTEIPDGSTPPSFGFKGHASPPGAETGIARNDD
jgi:pimeloyl-ACP methyl ester carboxylesterase